MQTPEKPYWDRPVVEDDTNENLFAKREPRYLMLLDLLRSFFAKRGIDYNQLRLILHVKMEINDRALQNPLTQTNQSASAKQKKRPSAIQGLWKTILLQGIFGVFFSLALFFKVPDFTVYFLLYSVFFVLFITLLIPQLAQVFLSIEDAQMLPVRPVSSKTLSVAKVLQVSVYYAINYLSFLAPLLFVGFLKRSIPTALIAIPTSLFLSVFALLLALALYLVVARFFSGEKLRNTITYVQILLSLISFAMYQSITPMVDLLSGLDLTLTPVMLLWPPTWFSAPFGLLTQTPTPLAMLATALAVISVVFLGLLYLKQSAKLETSLQDLALQKDGEDKDAGRIRDLFSRLLCRSPQEHAYFRFSWQMMRHERSFKTAVYPLILTYAALPYFMMLTTQGSPEEAGFSSELPIYFLYMNVAFISNILINLQMSDYAEAAWLFRIMPQNTDGALSTGLTKAVWAKLYLPLFLVQLPFQALLNGTNGALTIGVLIFLSYLVILVLVETMQLTRPFSAKRTLRQQEGCATVFAMFVVLALLAGLQGLITSLHPLGLTAYFAVLVVTTVLVVRFYRSERVFWNS